MANLCNKLLLTSVFVKVLSKAHALLLFDDNKFVILDTGRCDNINDDHEILHHLQLEWDVCEQCETKQSRSRERINGGFHWRYSQVVLMMICMLTVNDDDYNHIDCDRSLMVHPSAPLWVMILMIIIRNS